MSKPTVTITNDDTRNYLTGVLTPGAGMRAFSAATRVLPQAQIDTMRTAITKATLAIIEQYVDIVEPAAPKDYTVTAPARIRFRVQATNHEEATQRAHDVLDKNDFRDLLSAEGVEIDFGDEFLELEIDPNVRIDITETKA